MGKDGEKPRQISNAEISFTLGSAGMPPLNRADRRGNAAKNKPGMPDAAQQRRDTQYSTKSIKRAGNGNNAGWKSF